MSLDRETKGNNIKSRARGASAQNKRIRRRTFANGRGFGNQGIITVFVTLIMVPVVVITGLFVDLSRLKLYSSQAVMTADAYGEAVLSEFDNLLKELYGLFSVTQNKEGLEAIESLAKSIGYSFDPNGDDKGLSGFMPYKDADVMLEYAKAEGASLANNNVLMTQISDFMRFRIVEEVLDDAGILSSLTKFDSLDADMDAMNDRKDITDSCAEALGKIDNYYGELKKLAAYPDYLEGRKNAFNDYSAKLTEIAGRDDYEKYVNYLANKSAIDAAKEKYDRIAAAEEEKKNHPPSETGTGESGTGSSDSSGTEEPEETMTAQDITLYEQYVDAEAYKNEISTETAGYKSKAEDHSGTPINFDNTEAAIRNLGKYEKELRETLQTLKAQVDKLKGQLNGCSQEVREGIQKEISELEGILSMADDFRRTYQLIEEINHNTLNNQGNKDLLKEEVPKLNDARNKLIEGEVSFNNPYWVQDISNPLQWYDFQDDMKDFYESLQKLCDGGGEGEGDKKAGDKAKKKADDARAEAEKELDKDEQTDARDISSELASQLKSGGGYGEVPGVLDCFSGGLSFESLAKAGSKLLDKFLVTSYDFGMFSSRVSGIRPEEEGEPEGSSEEYADYSLTKVEMSRDVNYLYGAELEYLLGGYNKSVSNLNYTRNIICGVRMTMNFASTYMISEVNSNINAIANAASAAVAAVPAIGAAAAPLVRVAVSGALRLAFATIETAADWNSLKERKSVVLLKTKVGDLEAGDALKNLLSSDETGDFNASGESSKGIRLAYEDYLYIMMCLFVDDNTLLSRTSNLITLNVNQAKNKEDSLSTLDFKMENTVTAVKATCKVKADFVVIPENLIELYLKGTGTDTAIQVLENHYFGYSIIRGY